jgi:GNAT superfamily N-acetyltransferase
VDGASVARIRSAVRNDAGALARLFAAVGEDSPDLTASLEHGHVIVLDVGADALGAAALVLIDCNEDGDEVHARIRYLVVHPSLAGTGAAEQLIAAVLAMCDETGCVDLDLDPGPSAANLRR